MKLLAKLILIVLILSAAIYLILPSPKFPAVPPGGLRSMEPADTESVYRQGYFTNLTRAQIMDFYTREFYVLGQFRLNHPPEEAYSLVRDQTQSSFLEELVHAGREALYINGYVPTKPGEQINRNGVHYVNKITVRYVPSSTVTRLAVLGMAIVSCYLIYKFQYHV